MQAEQWELLCRAFAEIHGITVIAPAGDYRKTPWFSFVGQLSPVHRAEDWQDCLALMQGAVAGRQEA